MSDGLDLLGAESLGFSYATMGPKTQTTQPPPPTPTPPPAPGTPPPAAPSLSPRDVMLQARRDRQTGQQLVAQGASLDSGPTEAQLKDLDTLTKSIQQQAAGKGFQAGTTFEPGKALATTSLTGVAKVIVTPNAVAVPQGTTQAFAAQFLDSSGKPATFKPTLTWSVTPTVGATIDVNGNFVGQNPGNYIVAATASGVTGTATVIVQSALAPQLPPSGGGGGGGGGPSGGGGDEGGGGEEEPQGMEEEEEQAPAEEPGQAEESPMSSSDDEMGFDLLDASDVMGGGGGGGHHHGGHHHHHHGGGGWYGAPYLGPQYYGPWYDPIELEQQAVEPTLEDLNAVAEMVAQKLKKKKSAVGYVAPEKHWYNLVSTPGQASDEAKKVLAEGTTLDRDISNYAGSDSSYPALKAGWKEFWSPVVDYLRNVSGWWAGDMDRIIGHGNTLNDWRAKFATLSGSQVTAPPVKPVEVRKDPTKVPWVPLTIAGAVILGLFGGGYALSKVGAVGALFKKGPA